MRRVHPEADSAAYGHSPLAEVLSLALCAGAAAAAAQAPPGVIELIGARSEERDGTIFFDITDQPQEGYNKFILTTCTPKPRIRLDCRSPASAPRSSVGSNPWTKADPAKR